jgi:GT2 family glycosyltransferase
MDQVPAQFAQSLATLTKVGACIVAFQCGSLVYTSRENLAAEAVRRGADYVFWLDSDMMFAPDTLQRLMDDIEKAGDGVIMSGLYYRRVAPFAPTVFETLDIKDSRSHWTDFKEIPNEIFEVQGVGFGCILAPTEVFIDVSEKFGSMFTPLCGVGEDLSFCWRARQCGWKILCDPTIELGHVGHHVITKEYWQDYKDFTAAQEEK